MQVVSEFKLILGEDIETKFEESWEKYYPIINTCRGNCESQSECNALQVINKKLRPNGPASKAQGAFSFYKVIYNNL